MPAGNSKAGILTGNRFFEKHAFLPHASTKIYARPGDA
jgi:hypothetical protein